MATKKYNTMHQHEPLPIPAEWGGDAARFALRTEEALDDLYRIINRLKLSDLAGELKLTDNAGNETIAISAGGDITSKSLTTDTVTIGGVSLSTFIKNTVGEKIIVSDTQPDAHGVVWIKPVAGSGESGDVLEETVFTNTTPGESRSGNIVSFGFGLSRDSGNITDATCNYHVSVRLCNTRGKRRLDSVYIMVSGSDGETEGGTQIVGVTGLNKLVNAGDYITIDSEELSEPREYGNFTFGTFMAVSLILGFSDDGAIIPSSTLTLRAYKVKEDQSGDAVKTCEVYYLN